MSEKILFDGGIKSQLTKSSKGDCYYVSSKNECSCPGFHYRRTCKHVKAFREAVVKEHVIDLHDTKPGEVEYWQEKQEQKAMEPPKEDARLRAAHNLRDNIIAAQEA